MRTRREFNTVKKKLKSIEEQILNLTYTVCHSVNDELTLQLLAKIEEEEIIKMESDLNRAAVTLLEFSLENELYEVCSDLNQLLIILNRNAK